MLGESGSSQGLKKKNKCNLCFLSRNDHFNLLQRLFCPKNNIEMLVSDFNLVILILFSRIVQTLFIFGV